MEKEALEILKNIDSNVAILKYIFFFLAVNAVVSLFTNFRDRLKREVDDEFRSKQDARFQKAEYSSVISNSEDRLKNFPNDSIAIWWIARCHKQLRNFDKSREYFTRLHMLEPTWKKEYIDPYTKAIELEEQNANKAIQPIAECDG